MLSLTYRKFDWKNAYFKFFYPTFDFCFVILAISTYGYIFTKHKHSQRRWSTVRRLGTITTLIHDIHHPQSSTLERQRSVLTSWKIFRSSKFYSSVLLVLTFVIFLIIPDLLYLFYGMKSDKNDLLLNICWLSYAFSNFTDVIIYLCMQPRVKREFVELLGIRRQMNRRSTSDTTSSLRYWPHTTHRVSNLLMGTLGTL